MTTELTLFDSLETTKESNSYFREENNFIFDNFDNYIERTITLQGIVPISNFQYIRPELNINIKLNKSQTYLFRTNNINYLRIKYYLTDEEGGGTKRYYYFVKNINQISPMCIELECKMDVLNTYKLDNADGDDGDPLIYNFTENSTIKRCHRNRFIRYYRLDTGLNHVTRYRRLVDKYPENINPLLFKKGEYLLTNEEVETNSWYVIYMNENNPASGGDTEAEYINPVKVLFASDEGYDYQTTSYSIVELTPQSDEIPDMIEQEEIIYYRKEEMAAGGYVEIGGTQYDLINGTYSIIGLVRHNNDSETFEVYIYNPSTKEVTNLGYFGSVKLYKISNGWLNITPFTSTTSTMTYDMRVLSSVTGTPTYLTFFNVGSSEGGITYQRVSFSNLDLTNPKLIKVICLPYAPLSYLKNLTNVETIPSDFIYNTEIHLLEWNVKNIPPLSTYLNFSNPFMSDYNLTYDKESTLFPYGLMFGENSRTHSEDDPEYPLYTRDMKHESKLANSEFEIVKFVYDSFTYSFKAELVYVDKTSVSTLNPQGTFTTKYSVSPNLTSKFMFQFLNYVCEMEEQDYNNVLVIERNNEIPLYTNAYINYLRMGYNFDMKQAQRRNSVNWASTGLQVIGAVASFASSVYTGGIGIASGVGLLTGASASIMRNIDSAKSNDEAIKQKMLQSSMQSESVSGNDDISLFKEYSPHKAKYVLYQPSDYMKQCLYDLFWYMGYACNSTIASEKVDSNKDIWDLTHSRKYFNFIQIDGEIRKQFRDDDVEKELKKKYSEGVTFIHQYETNEWMLPNSVYKRNIENIENTFTL